MRISGSPKIAMIGAGSLVFCKTLCADILATPALQGAEIRLMGPTQAKLNKMEGFLKELVAAEKLPAMVWSTTDRRKALEGADYVICMVQIGGVEAFESDVKIPLKYGVDQCIGDSMGPGGLMRAARTAPFLKELVADMEALCPNALLLNYTNPMAAVCLALGRLTKKVQFVGLCHGVQTTLDLISRYVEVPKERIGHWVAGINHMAWFLKLVDTRDGSNLYPKFRANCERPEYFKNEKVRIEVMRHYGYFMTESTGHLSEYLPWFRSSERALKEFCDEPGFGGESLAYYNFSKMLAEKFEKVNYLDTEPRKLGVRSEEYCSHILEAHQTGVAFNLQGNVRNDGFVTNLPDGCCVEVPVFVDRNGLHPVRVGALPTACAALNLTNVNVQMLGAEAAMEGDPEKLMQAIALDPLTSAKLTLAEARAMTAELLESQAKWLPQFKGRKLKNLPRIVVPAGTAGVEVPTDPALAIANRFGELANRKV